MRGFGVGGDGLTGENEALFFPEPDLIGGRSETPGSEPRLEEVDPGDFGDLGPGLV